MDFEAILSLRKEEFEPWRALIVLDDKSVRRYVMCWRGNLVRRISDYPMGYTRADLWECVKVDYQALTEITGDSLPDVMARFRQLQAMDLIYPDGSIPAAVVKVLTAKMQEIKAL
jgi:hypothetical protein